MCFKYLNTRASRVSLNSVSLGLVSWRGGYAGGEGGKNRGQEAGLYIGRISELVVIG